MPAITAGWHGLFGAKVLPSSFLNARYSARRNISTPLSLGVTAIAGAAGTTGLSAGWLRDTDFFLERLGVSCGLEEALGVSCGLEEALDVSWGFKEPFDVSAVLEEVLDSVNLVEFLVASWGFEEVLDVSWGFEELLDVNVSLVELLEVSLGFDEFFLDSVSVVELLVVSFTELLEESVDTEELLDDNFGFLAEVAEAELDCLLRANQVSSRRSMVETWKWRYKIIGLMKKRHYLCALAMKLCLYSIKPSK